MPPSSGRKHYIVTLPGPAGGGVYQLYRWWSCIPKLSHRCYVTAVVVAAANRGKCRRTAVRSPSIKTAGQRCSGVKTSPLTGALIPDRLSHAHQTRTDRVISVVVYSTDICTVHARLQPHREERDGDR